MRFGDFQGTCIFTKPHTKNFDQTLSSQLSFLCLQGTSWWPNQYSGISRIRSQYHDYIWTASSKFGIYRLCEQRRFRRAVSPEPPLLTHTSSESRGTFRQKARSLAPLNGWACAVKICHDWMLEDINSLDGAHMKHQEFRIKLVTCKKNIQALNT